jgi:hypothetical protein
MDLNKFKTDPTLDEGVWLKLADAELKIARLGSPRYQSALLARLKPHRESIELGIMKDADAVLIEVELLADFILIDWRGNLELDGVPLSYSRENAIKVLQIEEFRRWVKEQAQRLENFRTGEVKESVAAIAKN